MVAFHDQHYSVHPTNDSAITITQKTGLENGGTSSLVNFVRNRDGKSLWLVYARRMPKLDADNRNSKARSKDTSDVICSFDPAQNTLCYSLFVSKGNDLTQFVEDEFCNIRTYKFHLFDLVLVWSFMLIPTWPVGDVVSLISSAPKLNGVKLWERQLDFHSFPPTEILGFHGYLMGQLTRTLQPRLKEHLRGELFEAASVGSTLFSKVPVELPRART